MSNHHHHGDTEHEHSILGELLCHLPYAIYSVAFAIGILSFITYFSMGDSVEIVCKKSKVLFHSFHFMHILFAATGTLITFFRFSRNNTRAILLGIFSPIIFCTLSDSVLPYIGGLMLGVNMKFHICFHKELMNVIPFLVIGILNGFLLSRHEGERQWLYAITSHAVHIFISSLAAIFYLVSHGCTDWYKIIGGVFVFLIFSVVAPCTFSDVVVPMLVAKKDLK